ncbi:MBL fold metallo-hydrolase [Pseudonocardia aurantiaca]|uniref:MBL fold metallo-hydrolase n=1 Tax=Pseudonocardia aurantiaca TaxID=75290 RepID=A0ABW4FDQ5_9PSEU
MIVTHIGGPTVLVELGGWRLLTDPTFDPAEGHYRFGWGTSSNKLAGPAVAAADLAPIDAVLLTHDHHGDNLDAAGRALLPSAGAVLTTVSGARRLGLSHARGLTAGSRSLLEAPGKPSIEVTATPARHGPPLSRTIVGDVVGFMLRCNGRVLWITGDTVLHRGLKAVAGRLQVDVAIVHMGGVRFPITGPVRYTLTARRAVDLLTVVRPRVVVPVHYEGWSHFKDGRVAAERAIENAPEEVRRSVRWLPIGEPAHIE